jgi:exodeoxyribonuclease V alpha subunit
MAEIFGYIERITFQSPESGYTVAQLKEKGRSDTLCIVGTMPSLKPGETIRCKGEYKIHPVYGKQFTVDKCNVEAPADVVGITKYLGSGLIKGIGPKYAARIVELFKDDTLNVIDQMPERLLEVEGLGKKRMGLITACWAEQKSIRDVMIFLQSHGVSPTYAQKIYKTYGSNSIKIVTENPYRLARDIFGVGIKTADAIAMKIGMAKEAIERQDAGLEYALSMASEDGHVCLPEEELLTQAEELLEISKEKLKERLQVLVAEGRIEMGQMVHLTKLETFVWLKPLFMAETGICRQAARIKFGKGRIRPIDTDRAIEWVQQTLKIELAENQKLAISKALTDKIQIITGGPGTGKSTITKAILAITEKLTDKIILAAPTGRAAKRMTEITGKKASTIHSLLEYSFKEGKFKRGFESPLDCDLIIIDEASMIDTLLMNSLLKAIPDHARVIFVGDINQLPSVGPGNVLKDMISSQVIPVTSLNEIFRQAAGSRIITNAHRINNGTSPDLHNEPAGDFFFIDVETPEEVLRDIVALVGHRLPKKYGLDPINDIQVLAPMRRGVIGTENLNTVLQGHLNPHGASLTWGEKELRVGDKVMQIKNNYAKEVFNGDIGTIVSIDTANQELVIAIDDKHVDYEFSDLNEVVLAYAVSIHKYQGSECPCVVMPVHTTHFKLLHRNLLYTGVTRGKKLVVLVGTRKAVALAVRNDEVKRRFTGLKQALTSAFSISLNRAL